MKKIFILIMIYLAVIFIYYPTTQESIAFAQDINIITETIKKDLEALEVNIEIPIIQGVSYILVQDKINQIIYKDVSDFREIMEKDAEEFLKIARKENWEIRKMQAYTEYTVHFIGSDILSISVFYYSYRLGAHGYTLQIAYNFNLATGEKIIFKDFIDEKGLSEATINDEIRRAIKSEKEKYFENGASFKGVVEEQTFYIENDGIVVYFGLYEIAPYAYGIRYFKIPYQ